MTETPGLKLAYVAGQGWRYPGEPLAFYAQVMAQTAAPGYVLCLHFPRELTLEEFAAPDAATPPEILGFDDGWQMTWRSAVALPAGAQHEYIAHTTVTARSAHTLHSQATLAPGPGENASVRENASVKIVEKGHYLRYMPALYESDELMGRFLMLFESFWGPIDGHSEQIWPSFDPGTTPADLLPWLATWLDLALNERWPEAKRRKLLQAAIRLYRQRGTHHGLQEYLEIYTGARAQIVEHRARNFSLGPEARLGQGVALGVSNAPHTFTVQLALPAALSDAAEARRSIEKIIEAEKPAHTAYTLLIE